MTQFPIYDEAALLAKISDGDVIAFRQLYEHHRKKTWFIGWKLLKSEAEADDVVQEIFAKLWQARERLHEIKFFNSYLNTMIRNHVYTLLLEKSKKEHYIMETLFAGNDAVAMTDQVDFRKLQDLLTQAIANLPPQRRRVFQLGKIEGWKLDEIAAAMGLSKKTVKKHMALAAESVRDFLRKTGNYGLFIFLWLYLR